MKPNQSLTVLIASDDQKIQEEVATILREEESTILKVNNLKAFFKKMNEYREVDLILYDVDLPSLNTIDAFAIERFYRPRVPTVLLHRPDDHRAIQSILDKGVIYRMVKPFNAEEFKRLFEHLRQRILEN